jgi:hypothetical protein
LMTVDMRPERPGIASSLAYFCSSPSSVAGPGASAHVAGASMDRAANVFEG